MTIAVALAAAKRENGDYGLVDVLRARWRQVDQQLVAVQLPPAVHLAAKAAERRGKLAQLPKESREEEARLKELNATVALQKADGELATQKSKENTMEAKVRLEAAKEQKAKLTRLRSKDT